MKRAIIAIGCLPIAGCASTQDQPPLVFARTQTFGATLAGTVPDQGAHLTLGFSDRNLAVVPTTTRSGEIIRATTSKTSDSLSVLGQFQATTDATAVKAGLGTFFSTGQAARRLSKGFAAQMGYKEEPDDSDKKPADNDKDGDEGSE